MGEYRPCAAVTRVERAFKEARQPRAVTAYGRTIEEDVDLDFLRREASEEYARTGDLARAQEAHRRRLWQQAKDLKVALRYREHPPYGTLVSLTANMRPRVPRVGIVAGFEMGWVLVRRWRKTRRDWTVGTTRRQWVVPATREEIAEVGLLGVEIPEEMRATRVWCGHGLP